MEYFSRKIIWLTDVVQKGAKFPVEQIREFFCNVFLNIFIAQGFQECSFRIKGLKKLFYFKLLFLVFIAVQRKEMLREESRVRQP